MNKTGRPKNKKLGLLLTTNNIENICIICGSNETYTRKGSKTPLWLNYKDGKICKKCYNKLVVDTKKYDRSRLKYRRLHFCGIGLLLSFELYRDKCEICGITKDKTDRIERHHYFYCVIMPWCCTIAICRSCHAKITHKGVIRVESTTRTCLICGKIGNYKRIGFKYKNGYVCNSHYMKIKNGKI